MNDIRLSRNFKLSEFECKDGSHQVMVDEDLLDKVQQLRDAVGRPLTLNSAYRNPSHNKKEGGGTNSQHLYGKAVDVSMKGLPLNPAQLAEIGAEIGFDGIGVGDTFVHFDVRGYPARWGYEDNE